VHQRAVSEGPGGDLAAEWAAENNVELEWVTLGVPEVHERLYRELTLGQGQFQVAFILHRLLRPSVVDQLVHLDDFQASEPIDGIEGIAGGMRADFTLGGRTFAVPFRHATDGLHYNEELLAEQGVTEVPDTIEEVVELAEKLTYRRADGTQVHGLLLDGLQPSNVINLARCWDGDFITSDFRIAVDEPPMINAVTLVKTLYDKGILPRAIITFTTEDLITWMQQGRCAMAISPSAASGTSTTRAPPDSRTGSRSRRCRSRKSSRAPSRSPRPRPTSGPPPSRRMAASPTSPGRSSATSRAWIRRSGAPSNGNGPVRAAAYEDPRVQEMVPYWQAEAAAIPTARTALPGFEQAARAQDLFIEEIQSVLVAGKDPAQAMSDLARRLEPLLPA
jgi:multiple sugar transport system substrate-binding protein